jgi:hypothetical protein
VRCDYVGEADLSEVRRRLARLGHTKYMQHQTHSKSITCLSLPQLPHVSCLPHTFTDTACLNLANTRTCLTLLPLLLRESASCKLHAINQGTCTPPDNCLSPLPCLPSPCPVPASELLLPSSILQHGAETRDQSSEYSGLHEMRQVLTESTV